LKPDWGNTLWDPISEKPIIKKRGGSWWSGSRCRPEPLQKKKKKGNNESK
jgi:hypothetical protein